MVTPSVPVKANSEVRASVSAAGKMLEGDDKPTLLRADQHYLHYITISLKVPCFMNSNIFPDYKTGPRPFGNEPRGAKIATVVMTRHGLLRGP